MKVEADDVTGCGWAASAERGRAMVRPCRVCPAPFVYIVAGNRRALTGRYSFDSYLTMYVERGRQGRLAPGQFERIAKALSDPRRFALLEAIASSAQCPYHQLCEDFPVTKATISHHLKELVQAGLVDSEREGQFVNTRVRRDVMRAYAAELLRRVGSERNRTD